MRPGILRGFHRVPNGLWWFLLAVEEAFLSVLSMNFEYFLPSMVMSWLTEQFVDFSNSLSRCLLAYLQLFRMCLLHVLWCVLA